MGLTLVIFLVFSFIDNFVLDFPTAEEVAQLASQHQAKMLPGLPQQMMPQIMQAQQAMYQAHVIRERIEQQGPKEMRRLRMGLAMGKDVTGDLNLKDIKINNKDIAA